MSKKMYWVVISGKIKETKNPGKVKYRMAALFKTSALVIDELFAGKKAVIKRNLDIQTANKYAEAIKKTGAFRVFFAFCAGGARQ